MAVSHEGLQPWFARSRVSLSALSLAVLSACGGGGGGGSDKQSTTPASTSNQPTAVDTRAGEKIRLGGVVSKGLLGDAVVKVWAVANGAIDRSQQLASGTTDATGNYSTGDFTVPGAFVVEVTARPCDNTQTGVNADKTTCSFHQDEATARRQFLPTGFSISAIVTAAPAVDANDVTRVNVTLFSEIAIQAALHADGGLTAANMGKAQALVNNLFGTTDLNTVVPKALPAANSNVVLTPAEARLAAMLSAASGLAADSSALKAIGCDASTAGTPTATQCVLTQLAANANLRTYTGNEPKITAALDQQLQAVVTANGGAELLAVTSTTSDKLTNPSLSVPDPADPATGAFTAVKNFFNDLVAYARSLFNQDEGEPFFAEVKQFEAATASLKFGGETLTRAAGTFQIGAQLFTAYRQSGGTTPVSAFYQDNLGDLGRYGVVGRGCWLADASNNPIAQGDSPANVAQVFCFADQAYAVYWGSGVPTSTPGEVKYTALNGFHDFALTPVFDGGGTVTGFNYTAALLIDAGREVVVNAGMNYAYDLHPFSISANTQAAQSTDESFPPDPYTNARLFSGQISNLVYRAADGTLQSMTITGDLPDDFESDRSLVTRHDGPGHLRSTNLARNRLENATFTLVNPQYDAGGHLITSSANFAGRLRGYVADGSTLDWTIDFSNGRVSMANNAASTAAFDAHMFNAGAAFKGKVDAARLINNGLQIKTFQGAFYNNSAASGAPFIDATIGLTEDQSHKVTGPHTPTNYVLRAVSFDGYVQAPNKPKIRVALTGAMKEDYEGGSTFGLSTSDAVSGDYFIYAADGSLKRDVTFTIKSPDVNTSGRPRVVSEFVDPTNKIAFGFGYNGQNKTSDSNQADTWAKVYVNKIERGRLDVDTGNLPLVSLTNGESFSLDTGTIQY